MPITLVRKLSLKIIESEKPTTKVWAISMGVDAASILPAVQDFVEPYAITAKQVANRILALQGVVAASYGIQTGPIVEWFNDQGIWDATTPNEKRFLIDPSTITPNIRWQKEAQWALLWTIGKIDELGLPTKQCDTKRMMDELIPPLGSNVDLFFSSVEMRPAGALLVEIDRHYSLWCNYVQSKRNNPTQLPSDLLPEVLYQREYAFNWLDGIEPWDNVQCDS